MKTYFIKSKDSSKRDRYASIIEKADGTYKISVSDPRSYSPASNYQIKALAKEVISSGFIHEAIYRVVDTGITSSNKLVDLLKENTQELKTIYLQLTKEWATKNFAKVAKLAERTNAEWLKAFNVETYPSGSGMYSTERSEYYKRKKQMERAISAVRQIVSLGEAGYLAKMQKGAQDHYEDSIIKLAIRLKAKGVDEKTNIQVTSGRVDLNFECTIKHDGKATRAYTIIASGPIQQPHYRYLVK